MCIGDLKTTKIGRNIKLKCSLQVQNKSVKVEIVHLITCYNKIHVLLAAV